jgi:hypothetical protein
MYIFVATCDEGADQAKFRRIALAESAPCDGILFFSMCCLMHQAQLCVRGGLSLAGVFLSEMGSECKYFATLAELVNTWRDSHKATAPSWAIGRFFREAVVARCGVVRGCIHSRAQGLE